MFRSTSVFTKRVSEAVRKTATKHNTCDKWCVIATSQYPILSTTRLLNNSYVGSMPHQSKEKHNQLSISKSKKIIETYR